MRLRWKAVLPTFGLLLFAGITYQSVQTNQQEERLSSRYFWWSFVRLDSDPLGKHGKTATKCENAKENCAQWDVTLVDRWVNPALATKVLTATAFPAFAAGGMIVGALSRLGVSEVWSFFVTLPLFIFGWFFFLGWVVDRLGARFLNSKKSNSTHRLDLTARD